MALVALGLAAAVGAFAQSPADLRAQITDLQRQRQARQADLDRLDARIRDLEGGLLLGGNVKDLLGATGNLDDVSLGERGAVGLEVIRARMKLADLRSRRAALAAQVAGIDQQIAERRARLDTLDYVRTRLPGDLEAERAHLEALRGQRPTQDDAGQLQWDRENTARRIRELEALQQQFQGGQPGTTTSSSPRSAQPQGAYATPPPAPAAPATPSTGYAGYPPAYGAPGQATGAPPVNWQNLVPPPPPPSAAGGGRCGAG